ncbi:hypothetical protein XU18_4146 [Perkinsela sp. CCAP 1560/4]|nr:hypothetical protein XU18_4146 [Perkinsela sp. CCAP 1560/4]|eukprot:KNH04658.1 hypothetical protein XU18_4146 [Perkinsela sp. CCAP 1560/4]
MLAYLFVVVACVMRPRLNLEGACIGTTSRNRQAAHQSNFRVEFDFLNLQRFHPNVIRVSAMPDAVIDESNRANPQIMDRLREGFRSLRSHTNEKLSGLVEPANKAWGQLEQAFQLGKSQVFFAQAAVNVDDTPEEDDTSAAPILIVPGMLGSVLEAKRCNATWLPARCMHTTEWYKTWFDLQQIAFGFSCWSEIMSLEMHGDGTTDNRPGISIRAMQDSIKAVSCYNPSSTFTCDNTVYLQEFFRFMSTEGNVGVQPEYRKNLTKTVQNYELKKNLDSLPYDFRRSMRDLKTTLFPQLKARVEQMYSENGNRKVNLVGHSLGGIHANLFLNSFVDTAWKRKFIRRFIPISVAYGGSVKAMHSVLLGESQGWPFPLSWSRPVLRTWGGLYAAFPRINSTLWGSGRIFTVGAHSYRTKDITKLLSDSGLDEIAHAFDALNTEHPYDKAPGVETHCLFSTGYPTMQEVHIDSFDSAHRDAPIIREDLDGDGSITRKSMDVCQYWKDHQVEPVQTTVYTGGEEHAAFMAQNRALWQQIFDIANFGARAADRAYVEL